MDNVKCVVFERAKDYRFRHRSIPDRERLLLVKRGSVTVRSDKTSVTANQGEFITISAEIATEAEYTGADNYVIMFLFDGAIARAEEGIRVYPHNADAARLMKSALDDGQATPYRLPAILCGVLHYLTLNDDACCAGDVRPVIRHINEHYADNCRVSEYASMAYVSESHFRKLFISATGMTPIEYRNHVRIKVANELISEGYTVAEAAEAVGFGSAAFYCRLVAREKRKSTV